MCQTPAPWALTQINNAENSRKADQTTKIALKSFTLVWVGPVTTKSPRASKKP
jgi:hypothetical protein